MNQTFFSAGSCLVGDINSTQGGVGLFSEKGPEVPKGEGLLGAGGSG